MAFEIRVNNNPFTLWETAVVRRSIDTPAGAFSFTSSALESGEDYPVKTGDYVQILVDGNAKVSGFVDRSTISGDTGTHVVNVAGRDTTQDIIDSSMPIDVSSLAGPISLKALCERVISALGANIPVVDESNADTQFQEIDSFISDTGRNAMQFLINFARKKQVYLVPNGTGKLLIFRPGATTAATPLTHTRAPEDNVLRYSADFDYSRRFNLYRVRSQDNFGFDDDADYKGDGVNRNGDVTDDQIRASRYLSVQGEESMTDVQTVNRAEEQANIRRALSTVYTATVQGVAQEDGTLWDIGQFVRVNDIFANMRGTFLIKEVEYTVDIAGGTTTALVCVPPDAYTVQGSPTARDSRRATLGNQFRNSSGTSGSGFVR
jgi:prophage tail gpP-like protein